MMKNISTKLAALGLTSALAVGGGFIAVHEGYVGSTYVDPVGIITQCYGRVQQGAVLGTKFTDDECAAQFADDLTQHNSQMMRAIKVPLSESEQIAYLSFHYNVGPAAFRNSTLIRKLNAGQRVDACIELTHACSRTAGSCDGWTFAAGRQLPGLILRRREERDLCLKGALSHES